MFMINTAGKNNILKQMDIQQTNQLYVNTDLADPPQFWGGEPNYQKGSDYYHSMSQKQKSQDQKNSR